jgi:CheY-like chemotaxis protein
MRSSSTNRRQTPPAILLVDDNRDGVIARRSVLEELGYRVVTAGCGSDALNAVEREPFDLVITDYKMSPVNGVELIAQLKQRNLQTPIILLTGFAESLGLRAESTGADVVIQKSANEVANLVRHTKRFLSPTRKPAGSQAGRGALSRSAGAGTNS